VVLNPRGDNLYAVCARSRRLLALQLPDGDMLYSQALEAEPTGVAASLEPPWLWVTCAGADGFVEVFDRQTGNQMARWPAGHGVCSPVMGTSTSRVYVCNRLDGEVQVFDLETGRELGRVRVGREPVAAVLTPDERLPDGRWAVVTPNLARFQVPTTQVEHGWMNDAVLSLIDLKTSGLRATVLLDERKRGAANPGALTWFADGQWLVIAHAGSHELSVIEIKTLLSRLLTRMPAHYVSDLTFLEGIRRRVPLRVNGARAIAVRGEAAWMAGYFSDTLEWVSLGDGGPVGLVRVGAGAEITVAGRGERLFNDATIGHQNWQSCASCHPAPLFTDLKPHAVGTERGRKPREQRFDTPTLIECWRTAPYLHDGSAVMLHEVLTSKNPEDRHGKTSHLTAEQIEDLAAYVLSL
jgi:mono/diheme cytochrome c family protein